MLVIITPQETQGSDGEDHRKAESINMQKF